MSAKPATKTTAKKTSSRTVRKQPAKALRTARTGKLSREETTPLILQAQAAYDYQKSLGRVEPGEAFADWRRDQVMDCVGVPGISKMESTQWRPVMAHFFTLAGEDEKAFELLNKTGKKGYKPKGDDDTFESCETYVHIIRSELADHLTQPVTHEKGHINTGWFLTCARQRSRKPSLTMETMAERLDPKTLWGLLCHVHTHIALREGRPFEKIVPRKYPKKADPGEMDETV